jgi:haloalkane dehalogenase
LAEADVPTLFINAEPGAFVRGRIRELVRTWPNLTQITVSGTHFIQEDSPDEIDTAVAEFLRKLRPWQAGALRNQQVNLTETADLQLICSRK